ncbi:MAG: RNA polymerase factor sigma-54 [Leptonema sp. (in: Bacteria)]|nr:RNA polymerase factor sigma-54 [Leptonema sp. (in: bacteria)]
MKQRLVQKQTQKLMMTQELRQSIELLQYSALDLRDLIEQEIIENPFLEITESTSTEISASTQTTDYQQEASHFDDASDYSGIPDYEASDRKQQTIENTAELRPSLAAHLLEQIHLTRLTEKEQDAAEVILSALDDKGFLTQDASILLSESGFDANLAPKLQRTIAALDPIGCGANDMQQSLIFQAELKPISQQRIDALLLLKKYFDSFKKLDVEKMAKQASISIERTQAAIEYIQSLEPVPGRNFSSGNVEYVVPDVIVIETEDRDSNNNSKLMVLINDSWIPDLHVNDEYVKIIEADQFTLMKTEDQDYLKTKFHLASFLIRGIRQRQRTLLRTTKAIVKFQEDFFYRGPRHLKPLNLKQVAEDLRLHESTVSRVTSNKYVQTKWGVYELKYFFVRGIKSVDGLEVESSTNVQDRIRLLIEKEKSKPLSDQNISDILKKEGIKIARRTVAKYRSSLGIPSADARRTHKKG